MDCVAHILLDMWLSLEGGLERATAEKTLALPEALMSNGCIARGGTSCPPPQCMLRFVWLELALVCCLLLQLL